MDCARVELLQRPLLHASSRKVGGGGSRILLSHSKPEPQPSPHLQAWCCVNLSEDLCEGRVVHSFQPVVILQGMAMECTCTRDFRQSWHCLHAKIWPVNVQDTSASARSQDVANLHSLHVPTHKIVTRGDDKLWLEAFSNLPH
jgi:hypothetical protein